MIFVHHLFLDSIIQYAEGPSQQTGAILSPLP